VSDLEEITPGVFLEPSRAMKEYWWFSGTDHKLAPEAQKNRSDA